MGKITRLTGTRAPTVKGRVGPVLAAVPVAVEGPEGSGLVGGFVDPTGPMVGAFKAFDDAWEATPEAVPVKAPRRRTK